MKKPHTTNTGTEGLSLSDIRFKGKTPDLRGQLRCHVGYDVNGRELVIVIPASRLEAKRLKFPGLHVLGTL